jgi:biotin synthase-like enzyme
MAYSFEIGPIRPPSESNSLLIRVTRNCPWNKCRFCIAYKDKAFETRSVEEIKKDIATAKIMRDKILEITYKSGSAGGMQKVVNLVLKDPPNESFRNVALWLYGGGENVFLQDANCLVMNTEDLAEVITYLKETFPRIKRVTGYARAHTAARKKPAEFTELRQAGLNRLHIGLESGYDPILDYMDKGETADQHIKGGRRIVEAGISLSEYIILGLGGKNLSALHARHTAHVLNEINPDFIRPRTLIINKKVPLSVEVANGKFIRATDDEIVREQRILIQNLDTSSQYISDHVSNLLPELEGKLPGDKEKLLKILARFEAMTEREKANFMVGRRVGLYKKLIDMQDEQRNDLVEQIKEKMLKGAQRLDPEIIFSLMEEFI